MRDQRNSVIEDPVLFEERVTETGKRIAIASLNGVKTLNALSLPMIDLLQPQLNRWQKDDQIVCVVLQGVGDRAFCAGGDIQALHRMSSPYGKPETSAEALAFFEREYRLDYTIHTYDKPVIVWGTGIVMGGGIGLLAGASHRVVTETTRMAMPEVTIGLYPDVGGSWFLNRAPGKAGLFLGVTGASFNATDAKFIGLADRFVPHGEKERLFEALCDIHWSENRSENTKANHDLVSELLREFEYANSEQLPEGNVAKHLPWINDLCDTADVIKVVERLRTYTGDDSWIQGAVQGVTKGCPITPYLVMEQLERSKHMSLKEAFQLELIMSVNCTRLGHFREGVRALLIDKDRTPRWQPNAVEKVTTQEIEAHFEPPWGEAKHPLSDL